MSSDQFFRLDSQGLSELAQDARTTRAGARRATRYFTSLSTLEPNWTDEFTQWISTADFSREEVINIVSDVAWAARAERRSPIVDYHNEPDADRTVDAQHAYNILVLQGARFDFRFDLILEILENVPASLSIGHHIYACFDLFARLGRGEDVPIGQVDLAIERAQFTKEYHLILHGLWFTATPEYIEPMLQVSEEILNENPSDHVANMRRASAMRRRAAYDAATTLINRAIYSLPPEELEVNADYTRERLFIQIAQEAAAEVSRQTRLASEEVSQQLQDQQARFDEQLTDQQRRVVEKLNEQGERIDARISEFEKRSEEYKKEADRRTSDALFKIVEIVSLFVALIAILATTIGASAIGKLSGPERAWIIGAGSIFLIGFFALVRRIVEPWETREARKEARENRRREHRLRQEEDAE